MNFKHYITVLKHEIIMLPQLFNYLFSAKKKAIYVGCTGMGNLGDEAILMALRHYLAPQFFLYEIPYKRPSSGYLLKKIVIKNPDYIILGGGTIIKKTAQESYLNIVIKQMAMYPNAKTAVLGPGVADEDFAKSFGVPIDGLPWKTFLDSSNFVSVRGILSKKQLEKWQVTNAISIFNDPAIYYVRNEVKSKSKSKKIALNFAYIGNKIYGKNPQLVAQFAKAITERLLKDNWTVFLYPTTTSDLDYMMNTIGLKEFKDIQTYENYTDIESSLSFIESMDIFLGQRLHSIIFAANTCTPFHAIEYEPKTSDFLLTTGFENYTSRTDLLDDEKVFQRINDLYDSIDIEQQKIFRLMQLAKFNQINCVNAFLSNN